MRDEIIEERAAAWLRHRPGRTAPLDRLYDALVDQLGPVVSSADALARRLRRRPGRFLLLDPPAFARTSHAWLREARPEYGAALRAAGVPLERRVVLVDTARPADVPGRIAASLAELYRVSAGDPTLSAEIGEALAQARELRRATGDHAG